MRTNFVKIKIMALSVLTTAVFLSSCDDEESARYPGQLFRPVQFTVTNTDEGEASFSWTPIDMATYLLEISRDSFRFDVRRFEPKKAEVIVSDLWSETKYWARVKSVSLDPQIRDSEFRNTTFTAPTENIFLPVESLGAGHILLKWDSSVPVTHIVMNVDGTNPETITLSSGEIAAGEKEISGLAAGTTYEFRLYQGERMRGRLSYSYPI